MTVQCEIADRVLTVTLDRPNAMNSIDLETNEALIRAWTRFRDDPELRAAVVTGAGPTAFCAGIDLKRLDEWYARDPPELRREIWDRRPGLGGITRNLDVGKPIIAAINGHCLGGGLEMALACDLRVASENATFGMPEVKWGIIPGQGGTQRLPRVIAPNLAMELILTGNSISARRAYEIGLVNRVVPAPELGAAARELARTLANMPPRAVRHAREAIRRGLELPLEEGLRVEQSLADVLRGSPDSKQARMSFSRAGTGSKRAS